MTRRTIEDICKEIGISGNYLRYHKDEVLEVFRGILRCEYHDKTVDTFIAMLDPEKSVADIRKEFGYTEATNLSNIFSKCISALTDGKVGKMMVHDTIKTLSAIHKGLDQRRLYNQCQLYLGTCHASIKKHNHPDLIKWAAKFVNIEPHNLSSLAMTNVQNQTHGFTWYEVSEEEGQPYYEGRYIKDVPAEISKIASESKIPQMTRYLTPHEIHEQWPYNMLFEIWGDHEIKSPLMCSTEQGLCVAVMNALDTLSEREKDILLRKYRDGMTFRAIGDALDRTGNRIAQIHNTAIRKMRHPARNKDIIPYHLALKYGYPYNAFLHAGISLYTEIDTELVRYFIERDCEDGKDYARQIDTLRELYNLGYYRPDISELFAKVFSQESDNLRYLQSMDIVEYCHHLNDTINRKNLPIEESVVDESPIIEELLLSVRAYNCLKKSGINTVDELIKMLNNGKTLHEQVRHLGVRTEAEIIEKLKSRGYIK